MILLIGNWKMAPEKPIEALRLAKNASSLSKKYKKKLSVVVCPSFAHLFLVSKTSKALAVGAQSVAPVPEQAHTGLISAGMLKGLGVRYCIVGHSEARERGETNSVVALQVSQLLAKGITPILCVGERERDHQGWYLSEVKEQLESVFAVIPKAALKKIVIAYEPVWAIGAGATRGATPAECREMIIYIRKIISDRYDTKTGDSVRILYGGSVDEKNANSFVTEGMAQGHLVGRISLDPKRFTLLAQSLIRL